VDVVQKLLQSLGAEELEERDDDGRTALDYAAMRGHEEVVTLLVSHGAQANSEDWGCRTPLMRASSLGHLGVVQRLLQVVGAERLKDTDWNGSTVLHCAAEGGNAEVVKLLLSHGSEANDKDISGKTALMTAATKGHLGVVQQLLQVMGEQGLTDRDVRGSTVLHHAAVGDHEEVVEFLLGNGAQANSKDNKGLTPLMRASHQGCLGAVQVLLQIVGDQGLGEQDAEGLTALYHAAGGGHTDVMAFLLTRGAQASSKDSVGITPLTHASFEGQLGAVKLLFGIVGDKGLAETDEGGATALHYAAYNGREEVAAWLLSHGLQANRKDKTGITPLMEASARGHVGMMQKLLQATGGQGLTDTDDQGWTALHFAVMAGLGRPIDFLISNGAQATSKDLKGMTPLMHACVTKKLAVVCGLLRQEGDRGLQETDQHGRTALHLACRSGAWEELVRMLLLAGADLTIVDNKGVTPRRAARRKGLTHLTALFEVSRQLGHF
jgi:ankyrin repeat protein